MCVYCKIPPLERGVSAPIKRMRVRRVSLPINQRTES